MFADTDQQAKTTRDPVAPATRSKAKQQRALELSWAAVSADRGATEAASEMNARTWRTPA